MSQQEKKQQRIYDLLNVKTKRNTISEITGVYLWRPSNPDLNLLNYAISGILENQTYATTHPNIDLLKTVMEEKWDKMSKGFILKGYKSFWRCVGAIIENNDSHIE